MTVTEGRKMEEIEELENGKLLFHSYEALKTYCDDVNNPLDKVVLGEEITALNSEDIYGHIRGLFKYSRRTNEQFKGIENWDMSNVTDMSCMFFEATTFMFLEHMLYHHSLQPSYPVKETLQVLECHCYVSMLHKILTLDVISNYQHQDLIHKLK